MRDFFKLPFRGRAFRLAGVALATALLAGCQADELGYGPKASRALGGKMTELMQKVGVTAASPVLMRIFKEESKFEVWKMDASGRYKLLKTYDICKWSGKLGPKIKEGDRQAPEGYYAITPGLLNPNSAYYLSFNTGFPNTYDRANGRTGTALMVHGACSSRGCYAMTDEQIAEIYALARDAFKGGQKAFQLQAYPFRMTAENMARHWDDPNRPFWQMLKEGYDSFELTRQEPKVDVCGRKYVFNATPKGAMNPVDACPELVKPADLQVALAAKTKADKEKAIVLAARFRAEREAEEQRQILIAQTVEEERKRAEAARLLAEQRSKGDNGQLIASLAGGIAGVVTSALPIGASQPAAVAPAETSPQAAPDGTTATAGTPARRAARCRSPIRARRPSPSPWRSRPPRRLRRRRLHVRPPVLLRRRRLHRGAGAAGRDGPDRARGPGPRDGSGHAAPDPAGPDPRRVHRAGPAGGRGPRSRTGPVGCAMRSDRRRAGRGTRAAQGRMPACSPTDRGGRGAAADGGAERADRPDRQLVLTAAGNRAVRPPPRKSPRSGIADLS